MRTASGSCLMEAKSNPWDSELLSRGGTQVGKTGQEIRGGTGVQRDGWFAKGADHANWVASNALIIKR
jgi:hypothetical protein